MKSPARSVILPCFLAFLLACRARAEGTDYGWIKGYLGTKAPYNGGDLAKIEQAPEYCTPIHIDLLSRHGSRYPSEGKIAATKRLEDALGKATGQPKEWEWVRNWRSPYPECQTGSLDDAGAKEVYELGSRFLKQFRSIFRGHSYVSDRYVVQTSYKPRAARSGNAFGYAIFRNFQDSKSPKAVGVDSFQPFYQYSLSQNTDTELYFHKNCDRYQKWKSDADNSAHQETSVWRSNNWGPTKRNVAKLIGTPVDDDLLTTIFRMCAMEIALIDDSPTASLHHTYNREHSLCRLFNQSDAGVMAAESDLEGYYKFAYGEELSYKMSVELLRSWMSSIRSAGESHKLLVDESKGKVTCPIVFDRKKEEEDEEEDEDSLPRVAHLRFAHAETLGPFLAMLGLFNDSSELKGSDTQAVLTRKWNSSDFLTMGANVASVLYACNRTTQGLDGSRWPRQAVRQSVVASDALPKAPVATQEMELFVRFLVNERDVSLPACDGKIFCPVDQLEAAFAPRLVGSANFDETCKLPASFWHYTYPIAIIVLFVFLVACALGIFFYQLKRRRKRLTPAESGYEGVVEDGSPTHRSAGTNGSRPNWSPPQLDEATTQLQPPIDLDVSVIDDPSTHTEATGSATVTATDSFNRNPTGSSDRRRMFRAGLTNAARPQGSPHQGGPAGFDSGLQSQQPMTAIAVGGSLAAPQPRYVSQADDLVGDDSISMATGSVGSRSE